MMDRPDGEVALQVSKRLLYLTELQIVAPQRRRIAFGQIAAQQIAPFAPARLSQLVAIERVAERSELGVDLDLDQAPAGRPLRLGLSEPDQQFVARQMDGHPAQVFQSRPQALQLPPAHRALLGDPVEALGEHIEFAVLRQQLDLHARARLLPGLGRQGLAPGGSGAPSACRPDIAPADRPRASRPEPLRWECRGPSTRCAAPCRIAARSCRGNRAASSCPRYCRTGPHRPAAGLPGSPPARSPLARSRAGDRANSRSGACRLPETAARPRNTCWSDRRAADRNGR